MQTDPLLSSTFGGQVAAGRGVQPYAYAEGVPSRHVDRTGLFPLPAEPSHPVPGLPPTPSDDACMPPEPVLTSPEDLRICLAACAAGGPEMVAFCARMPTPQLRVMCLAAGQVACAGFCYSRFYN